MILSYYMRYFVDIGFDYGYRKCSSIWNYLYPLLVGSRLMSCNIMNYLTFLTGKIYLDLLENILLEIILFPLSIRFSLICRMWAFSIIHNRPLGRADWAFALSWKPGAWVRFFFGLGKWACEPIFQTLSNIKNPKFE